MRTDPTDNYPVQFSDDELLVELAYDQGYDDPDDLIRECVFDSVAPGACRHCGTVTEIIEPDQEEGWCHCCGSNKVASVLVLGGVM